MGAAGGGVQTAALCKALDLWQRFGTLEKWARKARHGGGPRTGPAPHFTALAAEYPPVRRALVFVPPWQLPVGHPDFRPHRAGEEQAELAAAGARDTAGPERSSDAAGLEHSPVMVVPSDTELGLQPGGAQRCIDALIVESRWHHVAGKEWAGTCEP